MLIKGQEAWCSAPLLTVRPPTFTSCAILVLLFAGALLNCVSDAQAQTVGEGNPLSGLEKLKSYQTQRAASTDPDRKNGNGDFRPIAPGATVVIADLVGPGVITHIWNTVAARDVGYSRLLRLRIYWDGEAEPSVDCPLGDFFAVGHGKDAPVASLPVQVSSAGRARNCYWPMPFRRSARLTVTNEGREPIGALYWYVDWRKEKKLAADTAYFHAQYRQEFPTPRGHNYVVADIKGRGHYIGTVFSVRSRDIGWWGEGDDFFFVDGKPEPALQGTGTEDYFCDAWGVFPHTGPYYGTTVWEGNEALGGQTTLYRWHIADPITFQTALRFELEHKGVVSNPDGTIRTHFGDRVDDFSSVAFWYQTEPHKPFGPMPIGYARLYMDPSKIIEGEFLVNNATASAGIVMRQEFPGTSGGALLHWKPETAGQTLTVPLEVKETGTYDLTLLFLRSWDYGIYQVELDGQALGAPVDLFQAQTQTASVVTAQILYPTRRLSAGQHLLRFVNTGRNDKSPGYFFGLDGIFLIPTLQP